MVQRGGARKGAGRKPDPLKDVRIGAGTAQRILKDLNHEKEIAKLYRECGDTRLKVHILFRLRDSAFGRPGQQQEPKGEKLPSVLKVIVEHMGRPQDQTSAKTK
jgi:hypothetical protein